MKLLRYICAMGKEVLRWRPIFQLTPDHVALQHNELKDVTPLPALDSPLTVMVPAAISRTQLSSSLTSAWVETRRILLMASGSSAGTVAYAFDIDSRKEACSSSWPG